MMRRSFVKLVTPSGAAILAVLIMMSGAVAAQVFAPQVKGQEVKVKGEIIDLWCYLQGDNHGQDHKNCSTKCANMGNPIALLDEAKNETYILAGRTDYQVTHEVRDELIKRMNETVTVTGTLVKRDNTQLLYVASVER